MVIKNKISLLNQHTFLKLHLQHVAIGSWPCCNVAAKPTNIFFTVLDTGRDNSCYIKSRVTGKEMPIRAGYSYFIPFNHLTAWKLTPEIVFTSLHFNIEFFYGIDLFQNYPDCLCWEAGDTLNELEQLLNGNEETPDVLHINEIIYRTCRYLLQQHLINSTIDTAQWLRYEKVVNFVRKNGDAATRVEDLADIMNMRANVFSRNFTRDLGITPKLFLVNTLLRKASDMLRLPGSSVRGTAEALNFSSEYYFSTFFKKNTGDSPKIFQQRNKLKK